MRVKAFLTTRDIAISLDEYDKRGQPNTTKVRRQLNKMGVLIQRVGFQRDYQVSTASLKELDPNSYERVALDVRNMEGGCPHKARKRRDLPDRLGVWCGQCGALDLGNGWENSDLMEGMLNG